MKPRFVHLPEDVDVVAGSSAQLNCEVLGHPTPEINWTFNDGPVSAATDRRFEIDAGGRLRIAAVTERDAGTYRCTAGNTLGKITAAAQLRVLSNYFLQSSSLSFFSLYILNISLIDPVLSGYNPHRL